MGGELKDSKSLQGKDGKGLNTTEGNSCNGTDLSSPTNDALSILLLAM